MDLTTSLFMDDGEGFLNIVLSFRLYVHVSLLGEGTQSD